MVAAADIDQVGEQDRQWLRDGQIVGTEAQRDDVIVTVYLFGGHYRDPGQLLAVAEQEGAGDPVGELQGVVVVEAGDQGPARVGFGGRSGRSPQGRHEQRGAVVVFGGPVEEVPNRVAGRALGKPGVDIALAALGRTWGRSGRARRGTGWRPAAGCGSSRSGSVRLCSAPLGAGADAGPARWRRRAAADDARVAALPVSRVATQAFFQAGQGSVPGREHPGGDQDVSKVVGAASAGVGVERGVADRCGAGGEVGQHGGGAVARR